MASPPERRPSFFKVLNEDFSTLLRLPLLFTANYGKHLPEYPVLAIESGESWRVKIEEADEHQCFTQGWPEFAKDLRLELHDFLVFWFKSPSMFLVEVYGKTGPAKTLNPLLKGKVSPKIERDDVSTDAAAAASDDGGVTEKKRKSRPCFSVDMKYSNKSRLRIPTGFMRETGRMGCMCVVLKDPMGIEWPVLISRHGKSHKDRSDMTKGWKEFKAANDLVDGDVCRFTHTTETPGGSWVLQVQVERLDTTRTDPKPCGRPKREQY
ncbi:PREDICTED: B3 domain-containing protein REM5-like [Ipomoea nil]|uniref:B3 domain-containing protein REM5-like n=1 Tax=Ipomoea nil TaxID=35883 RepID=UPI000901D493|nr:PREDICTED: B3 domain-containing protein REM5-like [Ipomoea nil]